MADIEMGTLYDLNRQVMAQLPPQDDNIIKDYFRSIGSWFSFHNKEKYFMFMCKEQSDFTILHFLDCNYNKAIQELKELIEERGELIMIDYDHDQDIFECWIRNSENEASLYMLFEAQWMIIDI